MGTWQSPPTTVVPGPCPEPIQGCLVQSGCEVVTQGHLAHLTMAGQGKDIAWHGGRGRDCSPGLLTSAASQVAHRLSPPRWPTGCPFGPGPGHTGKEEQRQKPRGWGGVGSALLTLEHPVDTVLKNKAIHNGNWDSGWCPISRSIPAKVYLYKTPEGKNEARSAGSRVAVVLGRG